MSDEQNWLARGATSLTLMMMGFDTELDQQLTKLRNVLRQENLQLSEFKIALEDVERVYDSLEGITDKSIDTYKKTFAVLLEETGADILKPLDKEQPLLSDLLKIAEPLARHINTLAYSPRIDRADEELDHLRLRLIRRFKSLLETLTLMGDDSGSLQRLDAMLEGEPSWKMLDELASKTITLLRKRLSEEKKQFEGYLSQLTEKLTRINEIVEADSATLSELKQINIDFNSSINQQMSEARMKIDNQHTVATLKTDLLASLDLIANRLQEYQSSYGAKLQDLQASKVEMNDQIQSLEKENLALLIELNKERKMSQIDPLTQLPNRQGFTNRLDEELSRAKRYKHPLSIAILDIDFFKRINDEFGHLVGDKVLRMMAKEMKKVCRESDFISRFGGEEFILLLPQTNLQDAKIAVDKLRRHIAQCPFHYQNKPVKLTISGGVAELQENEETDSWLDRADTALYDSKRNGRDQVTAA
ncbi:GGDEF domain-containing protein [Reinekea sp. G2M2-21]|uniref:sensor domain-containing diguanylate cyclase n=1 Tax=Reinekea sp. G2M2-21 TaxID=2788942 RepID=UPI0018AACD24|nr:GGDEF domain-containing protein [Reinekea sp. G2M2-21]